MTAEIIGQKGTLGVVRAGALGRIHQRTS